MSTKISPETKQVLEWIKTEMTAGMVLVPKNDGDRIWNAAHDRSLSILSQYAKGEGLFQMTSQPATGN